jgi:hypothetical protein
LSASHAKVAEAVGIFDTSAGAAAAYEALNDPERIECIRNTILGATSAETVNVSKPEQLDVGDEGSVVHYSTGGTSGRHGSTDVISVKAGQCVATLLVLVEGTVASEEVEQPATDKAGELLSDGCGG